MKLQNWRLWMSMYKTPVISVSPHFSTQSKLIILAVSHRFVNLVLTFVFYMFYFEVTIFLHMCNILFSATFSSFVLSTFIQFCFLFFFLFCSFLRNSPYLFPTSSIFCRSLEGFHWFESMLSWPKSKDFTMQRKTQLSWLFMTQKHNQPITFVPVVDRTRYLNICTLWFYHWLLV